MVELVQILAHCHAALGESKELPLLSLQHSGRDVVGSELLLESFPCDVFSCGPHRLGVVPPNCGGTFKVVGSKRDLVFLITTSYLQLLLHSSQPIVCLQG